MIRVLGLDLSLRGTGMCILEQASDGAGFLHMVAPFIILQTKTVGYGLKRTDPEREKIERMIFLAKKVIDVVKEFDLKHIAIENYSFRARGSLVQLGELGGVIKSQLWLACDIEPRMIVASSARKDLLGKLPAKGAKKEAHRRLDAENLPLSTGDEKDAFILGLFMLRQLVHDQAEQTDK